MRRLIAVVAAVAAALLAGPAVRIAAASQLSALRKVFAKTSTPAEARMARWSWT